MAIASIALYLTLQLPVTKRPENHGAATKIEYPSALLLLLTVAFPLVGINLGEEIFPLTLVNVLLLCSLTVSLTSLLYYVESNVANTPLVPTRFVKNKDIAIALACTLPMKFAFDQVRHPTAFLLVSGF
jgi:hypothetical protein